MTNGGAVLDRPGLGEEEMGKEAGEDREFKVLLEEVRRELRVVAEGHTTLDDKIERVAQELSKKMDAGFADVLLAIRTVIKQLQEHERAHAT